MRSNGNNRWTDARIAFAAKHVGKPTSVLRGAWTGDGYLFILTTAIDTPWVHRFRLDIYPHKKRVKVVRDESMSMATYERQHLTGCMSKVDLTRIGHADSGQMPHEL